MFFKVTNSSKEALRKIKLSFEGKKNDRGAIPNNVPQPNANCNNNDKPSMKNKNKNRNNGFPWQIPLVGVKTCDGTPLRRMDNEDVVIHSIIKSTQND